MLKLIEVNDYVQLIVNELFYFDFSVSFSVVIQKLSFISNRSIFAQLFFSEPPVWVWVPEHCERRAGDPGRGRRDRPHRNVVTKC